MRRPASSEIVSDSVELCETEVCFLHKQLVRTNVRLPNFHTIPPEADFGVKISSKIGILETAMLWQYFQCENMNVRIQTSCASVTGSCPSWATARASLFTDHRMSGPPMRAKHNHNRTI